MKLNYENYTVLFVDNEPSILRSIKRGMYKEKFKKIFAESGKEALQILKETTVAVIVSDIRMPEMDGLELLKIVREKYPLTVRIVLTGYTQILTILAAINKGHVYRYIKKPWKLEEEFIPTIKESIKFHEIIKERQNLINKLKEKNKSLEQKNEEIKTIRKRDVELIKEYNSKLNKLKDQIMPYLSKVENFTEKTSLSQKKNLRKISTEINKESNILINKLNKLTFDF